jgi:hypothetical protein
VTPIWIGMVSLALLVSWLVRAAVVDMFSQEARTRLARIPFAVIRLARARLPRELRNNFTGEWNAELEFVLSGTDGMPITRLIRGIRYAVGLLLAARAIADGLTGRSRRFGLKKGVPMPVTIGDVWEAIDNSDFRPARYQAALGTAYLEGPDGRWIRLPNQSFMDWGLASDELLTILASWSVQPVASGKYPLPAQVDPIYGGQPRGEEYRPAPGDA